MAATAGIIAAGHELTAQAGRDILDAGGNAFDAALGALCAATVCEPLLTSLGGGGFLLAQPGGGDARVYDFFVQTPARRRPEAEIEFYPILADFGTAQQEFHIGLGSMAVPGTVAGLFAVHRDLCSLPLCDIVAPAVRLGREGVRVTDYQHYVGTVLERIVAATPDAMRLVATPEAPDRLAPPGSVLRHPELADTLETLAREGEALFYRGELARQLVSDCERLGGQLTLADLAAYQVIQRDPVRAASHGAEFLLNPPPSPGGSLVALALALLEPLDFEPAEWGSARHGESLARVMDSVSRLRARLELDDDPGRKLAGRSIAEWREVMAPGGLFSRGTTHISVADEHGNLVALTSSNGEGCAYVLPATGIMMNNMLGEEDLAPLGFHRWPEGRRLASMMCPSLATLADGTQVALGSGGSNRIRSAVLQVLFNLFGFSMPLEQAVRAPRMHLEGSRLSLEAGFSDEAVARLRERWPELQTWPGTNLFFGGVHAVERLPDGRFRAAGDPRRGGAVAECP